MTVTVAAGVVRSELVGFGLSLIVGSIYQLSVNFDSSERTLIPLQPHAPARSHAIPQGSVEECGLVKNHRTDDVLRSMDGCGKNLDHSWLQLVE